jgi:hypothetical protein
MEHIVNILVAIFSSIITYTFNQLILPCCQGKLQKCPNVSGNWNSFNIGEDEKEQMVGTMRIKQYGKKIIASVSLNNPYNPEGTRTFKYKGHISSGQILLIWKEGKGESYNEGTMALHLSSNLNVLSGFSTFYHHDSGKMRQQAKIYKRVK